MSRDRVPIEEVPRPESLNGWMAIAWAEGLAFRLERRFDSGDRYLLELPDEKIRAEGPELLGVVESVFRMWLASSAGEALRERLWATRPQGYREWAPQATARLEWVQPRTFSALPSDERALGELFSSGGWPEGAVTTGA